MKPLSSTQSSVLLHFILFGFFYFITHLKVKNQIEVLNLPVIYQPILEEKKLKEIKKETKINIKSVNKNIPTSGEKKEVFGLNRNSHIGTEGISVKQDQTAKLKKSLTNHGSLQTAA